MKIKGIILKALPLLVVVFFVDLTSAQEKLNIAKYLKEMDGEIIAPSAKQIELLQKVMPKSAFQPAPNITDRTFGILLLFLNQVRNI